MFDLILLFIDVILFVLSFTFVIIDFKSYVGEKNMLEKKYVGEKNEALKGTFIPKKSRYALLFGLLALVLAVFNSLFYV